MKFIKSRGNLDDNQNGVNMNLILKKSNILLQ